MRPTLLICVVVTLSACTGPSGATTTVTPTSAADVSTTAPPAADFVVEPIEEDWTVVEDTWDVTPSCCDQPATGPPSPEASLPTDGWPQDGYYDVSVRRLDDPPGELELTIRRWIACASAPERCIVDAPPDAIVADPTQSTVRFVPMDENLRVVIRPIGESAGPGAIAGSGAALYELLSGFCTGSVPPRLTTNCGVDHAHIDWIWDAYWNGATVNEIVGEVRRLASDPGFPLGPANGRTMLAYRGPHGTELIMDVALVESSERWPGYDLYGWWTSLRIENGRPTLLIDAGQIAG